jgi:hypothetical protein
MIDLHDNPRLSKSTLLQAAKRNPDSIVRLSKYLRLYTTAESVDQLARLISWLLKKEMLNHG